MWLEIKTENGKRIVNTNTLDIINIEPRVDRRVLGVEAAQEIVSNEFVVSASKNVGPAGSILAFRVKLDSELEAIEFVKVILNATGSISSNYMTLAEAVLSAKRTVGNEFVPPGKY